MHSPCFWKNGFSLLILHCILRKLNRLELIPKFGLWEIISWPNDHRKCCFTVITIIAGLSHWPSSFVYSMMGVTVMQCMVWIHCRQLSVTAILIALTTSHVWHCCVIDIYWLCNARDRILYFSPQECASTSEFWHCRWVTMSCTCVVVDRTPLKCSRWRRKPKKNDLHVNMKGYHRWNTSVLFCAFYKAWDFDHCSLSEWDHGKIADVSFGWKSQFY